MLLLSYLLTFFKINFLKKFFQERRLLEYVSNGLDADQERHSVSPDLDPNCLQRLSTDKEKSALASSDERTKP